MGNHHREIASFDGAIGAPGRQPIDGDLGETVFPSTIIGLVLIVSGIALQKLLA